MTNENPLVRYEIAVLACVTKLKDQAHASSIKAEMKNFDGGVPLRGAIYPTLERLQKRQLLSSSVGEPTPVRGGRRKRFYAITDPGKDALKSAKRQYTVIFNQVDF